MAKISRTAVYAGCLPFTCRAAGVVAQFEQRGLHGLRCRRNLLAPAPDAENDP